MPYINRLENLGSLSPHRVETGRFGPFVFELGLDLDLIERELQRVEDAHERFIASPLSQVANQLEREVVVSSVFGTNTIEGGTLSEDETASSPGCFTRAKSAATWLKSKSTRANTPSLHNC